MIVILSAPTKYHVCFFQQFVY